MRFTPILAVIAVMLFSSLAIAENVDDLKKSIVLDQQKLVVVENLPLSDDEAAKFWPAFRDYQEKLYELDAQKFKLLSYYLRKHKDKSLTDEEAAKMIDAYFAIEGNRHKLVREFALVLDLEKILPVKKIFRYLQIQQNMDAGEQFEISKKLPLLE